MEKFNPAFYIKELTFDLPIEFNGLVFTPVTVDDYEEFYTYANCMLLDKNSVPDIKIIQMSYLDYIFYMSKQEDTEYMSGLMASLISLCTGVSIADVKYRITEKGEHILIINGNEFDKNEFLYMRSIICEQNDVDLSIFDLDPRVREELRKTMALKNKQSSFEIANLEEQIICILISTSLTTKQIRRLSLKKFKKIINRIDHKMNYEMYTLGSISSGNLAFKEEMPHWLATLEKGKFDKLITSYDEVKGKVEMSNLGI